MYAPFVCMSTRLDHWLCSAHTQWGQFNFQLFAFGCRWHMCRRRKRAVECAQHISIQLLSVSVQFDCDCACAHKMACGLFWGCAMLLTDNTHCSSAAMLRPETTECYNEWIIKNRLDWIGCGYVWRVQLCAFDFDYVSREGLAKKQNIGERWQHIVNERS